jgi:hypothetical protein
MAVRQARAAVAVVLFEMQGKEESLEGKGKIKR